MKKKIITALTAVMIIASSAVPTMANTVGYNFTFYSPEGFVSSNSGTKMIALFSHTGFAGYTIRESCTVFPGEEFAVYGRQAIRRTHGGGARG